MESKGKNNKTKNSTADIQRMQQEAIKRVQEMQKRAKVTYDTKTTSNIKPNQKENQKKENAVRESKKSMTIKGLPNMMESLFNDKEKSIILILIMILAGEHEESNIEIILILFYILS